MPLPPHNRPCHGSSRSPPIPNRESRQHVKKTKQQKQVIILKINILLQNQTGGVKLVGYLSTYRHFVHNKNAYLNKEIGVFTLFCRGVLGEVT